MTSSNIYIYVLIGFIVNFIYISLISLRYIYILRVMKRKLSLLHSSYLFCISQTVNYLTPFKIGGILIKPVATRWFSKIPLKDSFFVTIFEQLFDYLWQIVLFALIIALAGERFLPNFRFLQIIFIVTSLVIILFFIIKLNVILQFMFKRAFKSKYSELFSKTMQFVDFKQEIFAYIKNPRFVFIVVLLTVVFALFAPLLLSISLVAFGVSLSYSDIFLLYWASFIVGRISGIPGGFGSRDLTIGALLVVYGLSSTIIIKSIILYRVITIIPNVVIGGGFIIYYSSKYGFKLFSRNKQHLDKLE